MAAATAAAAPRHHHHHPRHASPQQQLQDTEQDRASQLAAHKTASDRAQQAGDQADQLARARVAAAARLRLAEAATQEAATRMAELAERERQAEASLAARAKDLTPMLPVIERLSLYPAETLLAVPASPDVALQGVLVLKGMSSELEHEAAALRAERQQVAVLRAQEAAEAPILAAAQAAQAAQAAELDRALAAARQNQSSAQGQAAEALRRAAEDAARASDLRAAIAMMDAARQRQEALAARQSEVAEAVARKPAPPQEKAKREENAREAAARQVALSVPAGPGLGAALGQLQAPVLGHLVRAFGADTDAGPANGISYRAPPAARVVSPCAGRVDFAGPFRSYGQLLIVNCGGGYHFVLAGLDRLDVQLGRPVQAGEPVGVMPGWDPHAAGGDRPALYVELRHDGQPVNPAPFIGGAGVGKG
jgi:murein hydrolase activator